MISSCSNWERGGKRLEAIIELSKHIDEEIYLIGKCDIESTGSLKIWQTKTCNVKEIKGIHDVYFRFSSV